MKFFQCIVLGMLCLFSSGLHALYLNFNIGEEINQSVLSPDGKFLASTNYDSNMLKLWNTQTGQLHAEFKSSGDLFFSCDSTMLFASEYKKLKQYKITEDKVLKIETIVHNNDDFGSNIINASYTCVLSEDTLKFTNVIAKGRFSYDVFITTLLPNGNAQTQELDQKNIGFYIHAPHACTISPDAKNIAVVCDKVAYGSPYIHVVDVQTETTTHNYYLKHEVNSISFSPDKTKLIVTMNNAYRNIAKYWCVIINLDTNQSSWFKQAKQVKYASFINNTQVLTVLNTGEVFSYELTVENLENNRVTRKNRFKFIEKASNCH